MSSIKPGPARMARARVFVDAPDYARCEWTTKQGVRCGRAHSDGQLCTQHQKQRETIVQAMTCCGGSDENPPEHTMDCHTRIEK